MRRVQRDVPQRGVIVYGLSFSLSAPAVPNNRFPPIRITATFV